jgi:hypothetical protein
MPLLFDPPTRAPYHREKAATDNFCKGGRPLQRTKMLPMKRRTRMMAAVLQQGGETSDSISISKSKDYCRGIRTTTSTNNQGAVFLLSSHSIIALHCPAHWPLSHIAPPCPFQSFQFSLASLTILSRSLLFGWLLRRLCGLQSIPSHRHALLSFSWLSLSWRLSPPPSPGICLSPPVTTLSWPGYWL